MPDEQDKRQAIAYVVDLKAGDHRYVFIEGIGECRENFAKLVSDLESGKADAVIVAGAHLFYADTSPMWMEQFIAIAKQQGVMIIDAASGLEYDLRKSVDEKAFRKLEEKKPRPRD